MGTSCCHGHIKHETDTRYRGVLWVALAVNLGMFIFETGAGLSAGSVALRADALDFFADGANFAISLFVLRATLRVRAMAALAKAGAMAVFGLWLVVATARLVASGTVPEAPVMGVVGVRRAHCQWHRSRTSDRVPASGQQHTFGMDLHSERCPRQSRCLARCSRRVRHRPRLAGRNGRRLYGVARALGLMANCPECCSRASVSGGRCAHCPRLVASPVYCTVWSDV